MRAFARYHRHLGSHAAIRKPASATALAIGLGGAIAAAKTVAAIHTGSASMQAEAVQSWVATFTEILLVVSYLRARKPADASHPFGYGRDSYVWSLFAAIAMFLIGAEVSLWRGLSQFDHPEPAGDYRVGYAVVVVSFVMQALSLREALRFTRERAAERQLSVLRHVFVTSDAQLRAVVTDDFLSLIALAIAGLGMLTHQLTGDGFYDALGSVLIGALLMVAGLFLINQNRRYLAGVPLSETGRQYAIGLFKSSPYVKRVTGLFAEFAGPDRLVIAARVELIGEHSQAELARRLRQLEQQIMKHENVVRANLTLSSPEEPSL